MEGKQHANALNMDLNQQEAFIRYYNGLPEKAPSTVRFFNRGDYYTVHGSDTEIASKYTANPIKIMGQEPKLSYVVLSKSNFETSVRELLLVKQYRVEVYIKDSSTKNNDWILEYKGSPGNLSQFEEIIFDNPEVIYSNIVMAIKIKNKVLSIACVDVGESKFIVGEIADNDTFSELEAILAQLSPKECIIPSGESPELTSMKQVLERNGVLVAKVKRSEFNCDEVEQNLNRLLHFHEGQTRNAMALPETDNGEIMGSLQALINFLNLCGDECHFNRFKFDKLDIGRYVRLDNAALYALNVLPEDGAKVAVTKAAKNSSLYGILNYCCTNQGKRLLMQWIKQPLRDYNLLNERLDIVECFVKQAEIRTELIRECLPRLSDMTMLLKKVAGKKASLQDCYRLYQIIGGVSKTLNLLRSIENECINSALVGPINELLIDCEKYQLMIEQIIDLDLVDRGEFFVRHTFDEELKELHEQKMDLEEKMQKHLGKVSRDIGLEDGRIKLECNDQRGYFFRITLKDEPAIRNNSRYKIIDAIKGGARFTTDKLDEINEDYSLIKTNYEIQQKAVLSEMFEVAVGYVETLRNLNMYTATLDVLLSFATAAVSGKNSYIRPKLYKEETGILRLKKVRHPCLEQQDNVCFIPNDVEFSKEDKIMHIITGPNMGGKSTYIRSIGVCVLMAHIGSFVPCDEAEISLVDAVLARVGADDCQLKGLSTFMLEMIETSTIINSATDKSLVIIDELGRGTSTYEGCGLAWAIAEFLVKEVKCFSLFATHFHEIIRLAEEAKGVNNLHVAVVASKSTLTPLFQVKSGPCDKSYGIHCARMVGFPKDVIEFAEEHLKKLENYSGMRYITDYEVPIKQRIVEEGKQFIHEKLQHLKSLNLDNLSDEELMNEISKLRQEAESCDNLFVKGVITDYNN